MAPYASSTKLVLGNQFLITSHTAVSPANLSETERSALQLDAIRRSERRWAYALLRTLLGINLLGHGVIRILHGVPAFASGVSAQMNATPLPPGLVNAFAVSIPWIELTLGILIILGLLTRVTLTVAMLFMMALTVGVTLRQDWPTAGLQLIYGFVIFTLLFHRPGYDVSWLPLLGLRPKPWAIKPVHYTQGKPE